jgi:membrane-associated protease RseP (regulator of RpoE activity)
MRQPVWAGAQAAVENVGAVAGIIWQLPVKIYEAGVSLVTGEERDPNGPLSVVGAGILAGEVAAVDAPILNRVSAMLGLLASLNIALFVFNLIPLLPLDGGHVAVALWEGIKRVWAKIFRLPAPKPVDATKLVPVTFVVVVALIVMGGVLILADIFNPISILGP